MDLTNGKTRESQILLGVTGSIICILFIVGQADNASYGSPVLSDYVAIFAWCIPLFFLIVWLFRTFFMWKKD